jgi:hypothetical protein
MRCEDDNELRICKQKKVDAQTLHMRSHVQLIWTTLPW